MVKNKFRDYTHKSIQSIQRKSLSYLRPPLSRVNHITSTNGLKRAHLGRISLILWSGRGLSNYASKYKKIKSCFNNFPKI